MLEVISSEYGMSREVYTLNINSGYTVNLSMSKYISSNVSESVSLILSLSSLRIENTSHHVFSNSARVVG